MSVRRGSIGLVAVLLGCAGGSPLPARAHDEPGPEPIPGEEAVPADASPDSEPREVPEIAAQAGAPDETPPLPVAPDGTKAIPCSNPPDAMACIPGGPFLRGTDDGPENARPAETVWVQTFYMDVYEVTYAQYKACQKAGACPRAGPRYTDFDHPNMPIQGVSWFDAVAFCEAHGKRLPTEAQWEKAARGDDGRLYPWGNDPITCERAIYKDAKGRSCGLQKAISKPETGRPWDVGSRPPGIYGLYDMVGNSWEWVADWYSKSYAHCGEACRGIDPTGPCAGAESCPGHGWKVVRGGSWYWDETRQTTVFRRAHVPSNDPFHHFGFRCAATVDDVAARKNAG
jgi:formylglycine-generating enzyme